MCGIAGIFAFHYAAPPVDRGELLCIRDAMIRRGPDGSGEWISKNKRIGLAHRRLAIIDLDERAAQPMTNETGTLVISFNGEIYNYRELRGQLEAKGYRFKTQSDTEVLLHLYEEKKENMLQDLRGMFAFILWDEERKALWMVRDPYGIKPLYYANDGWTVRVASQVKALLQSPRVSRIPEPAGWVGFCLLGSVPEPFTTYQEIRSVPAGSSMWVTALGVGKPHFYFSLAQIYADAEKAQSLRDDDSDLADMRNALKDSVRQHLVADVPVALFLSAGIDSTLIAGLIHELGIRDIHALTLVCNEFKGTHQDEAPLALETAKKYALNHHEIPISGDQFYQDLPAILRAMDQPTIDGINTYFISQGANRLGLKVALSGLGGDELFGGYETFKQIPNLVRFGSFFSFMPGAAAIWKGVIRQLISLGSPVHPKMAGLLTGARNETKAYLLKRGLFLESELSLLLDPNVIEEGLRRLSIEKLMLRSLGSLPKDAFAKVSVMESSFYLRNQLLRDADWAGMAHSVEIRTPFVDSYLLKKAAPLMMRTKDFHRKKSHPKLLKQGISPNVVDRKKTGFSTPHERWMMERMNAREAEPLSRQWGKYIAQHFFAKAEAYA